MHPQRLERLFGDPLPEREAAMWALMDVDQRARALQRADALVKWRDGEAGIAAKQAAADAGVTLVRFYQMNAAWRAKQSLAALGVGAAPERSRRSQFAPAVNAAMQSALGKLEIDGDSSVRSLALRLSEAMRDRGVPDDDIPGHNTLRAVVERARRDRGREDDVGNELLLDHAACGISREDGAPWTIFVIADAASQLILGAAPGEVAAVALGYADAARDAVRRLADPAFPRVRWADRLARMQIVPGTEDRVAFGRLASEAAAIGVGMNLTSDRKAGRYLEKVVGRAIGVLPIWPSRVGAEGLPSWASERAPRLAREKATARIVLAVDDHNAAVTGGGQAATEGEPSPGLRHLLEVLATTF